MKKQGKIHIEKSIYDERSKETDGVRILVMRMWPRGIKKTKIDKWMKELGTQKELIKVWKAGKLTKEDFRSRYLSDLEKNEEAQNEIKEITSILHEGKDVSLLCGERDATQCHRSFLKQVLDAKI